MTNIMYASGVPKKLIKYWIYPDAILINFLTIFEHCQTHPYAIFHQFLINFFLILFMRYSEGLASIPWANMGPAVPLAMYPGVELRFWPRQG